MKNTQKEFSRYLKRDVLPLVTPLTEGELTAVEASFELSFGKIIIEFHSNSELDNWCCLFTHPSGKPDYLKVSDLDEEGLSDWSKFSLIKGKNIIGLMKILNLLLNLGCPLPDDVILQEGDWYVGPCFAFDWTYSYAPGKIGNFIVSYNLDEDEYYYCSLESSAGKEFFGLLTESKLPLIVSEINFLKSRIIKE